MSKTKTLNEAATDFLEVVRREGGHSGREYEDAVEAIRLAVVAEGGTEFQTHAETIAS